MAGSIYIPLISAFDAKGIREAKTAMSGLAGVVKNLKVTAVAAAASFATIGIGNFVKESVVAARDLERNMVGLRGVFGDISPTMEQFAKDASAIGLSQVEASRASTFLGSVLKQSGFTMEDTAEQTKNLVGLASDLAATYGYDVSEALTGMTALFRGEYDPIEKFGVAMKQAEVNAVLAARGQKALTGAALRNAQAQARLDLLYSRSQDAQGAYARQSESLFVKQKNLTAVFENMKAAVGASLTDPLAKLLDSITPILVAIGPILSQRMEVFSKVIQMLTPLIEPLINVFLILFEALSPITDVLIELIEPLLVPLVALFKLLGTILKPLIPVITFVARLLGAILVPAITVLSFALTIVITILDKFIGALASIPVIGDAFQTANNSLKGFTSGVNGLNDKLLDVKMTNNSLTGELSKDIPSNPVDGVKTSADKAIDSINNLKDKISSLIDDARNTQKSLMGAFDITSILESNQDAITESIVYVDGKFKAVVTGVQKGSQDLVGRFAANLTKLKTFYSNLTKLAKQNLSPELRQQLIDAGPEAGNATAEAILASGKAGIKGLNKTFAGIKSLAGTIGVQSAKAMSSVGEKLGNGLIDGLISQRESLIAQATSLANDIADAMSTAIGNKVSAWSMTGTSTAPGTPGGEALNDIVYQRGQLISPIVAYNPNASNALSTMRAGQLVNPFAANEIGYSQFQSAQTKANKYNIAIRVEAGAAPRDVATALMNTIAAYERTNGAGWRTN